MTYSDVVEYFAGPGSTRRRICEFSGATDIAVDNWERSGRIPFKWQRFFEEETEGALKAEPDAWKRDRSYQRRREGRISGLEPAAKRWLCGIV